MMVFRLLLIAMISGCYNGMEFVLHGEAGAEPDPIDTGIGIPYEDKDEEVWVDSFVQEESFEKIDVLWVIDRSCSMRVHDARLTTGVEAMMNAMPPDVNWRLKMITAGNTKTQSTMFPLTRGDTAVDAINMLNDLPADGGETGFDAVYDYVTSDPYGMTWLRPDAALLTVFVSDEEEQSGFTSSTFLAWYNLTRPANFLSFVGNVKDADSVCSYTVHSQMLGQKYMDAVNGVGGVIVDICEPDWSPGVAEATDKIIPLDFVSLTHIPHEKSIRVFIDGSLVAGTEWTYDASLNEVVMNDYPLGGSFVEAAYTIKYYVAN